MSLEDYKWRVSEMDEEELLAELEQQYWYRREAYKLEAIARAGMLAARNAQVIAENDTTDGTPHIDRETA
jgi:hypothetical protein